MILLQVAPNEVINLSEILRITTRFTSGDEFPYVIEIQFRFDQESMELVYKDAKSRDITMRNLLGAGESPAGYQSPA